MSAFSPSFDELRGSVAEELHGYLEKTRGALPEAGPLLDEISRLLEAGGKRMRPLFCYWGYRAAGGSHAEPIVRASASLELLHTFAIVHDDIMDAAEKRRGEPTVHAAHGVEIALLTGDLALVLADDLFVTSGFPPHAVTRAFALYSRMRQEVIAGQFLDVRAAAAAIVGEDEARRIARLKSGRYSVQEPLAIGASLAAGSEGHIEQLSRFGAPLGEAFQLRDDLLGTFGTASSTGKPVDSDMREGKRNVLYAKTVASLSGADRTFFVEHWGAGSRLSEADAARLRALIESSGARAATEKLLEALAGEAADVLATVEIEDDARQALAGLARLASARES